MPRPLVVFSHLRWDFVTQRPQHVLSRLADRRPVVVVEEPVHTPGAARWERQEPAPGVTVLRPHTPVDGPGFSDAQIEAMQPLVASLAAEGDGDTPPLAGADVWLYTPLALPLVDALRPAALVYDCMDELSAFDHAPAALIEREAELLTRADLVFTGGPSLYRAKRQRTSRAHCFPVGSSRVDLQACKLEYSIVSPK